MGLWSRMEKAEVGTPPQFLSTHPSSHNRLQKIQSWLPDAEKKLEQSECHGIRGYGKHGISASRFLARTVLTDARSQ